MMKALTQNALLQSAKCSREEGGHAARQHRQVRLKRKRGGAGQFEFIQDALGWSIMGDHSQVLTAPPGLGLTFSDSEWRGQRSPASD